MPHEFFNQRADCRPTGRLPGEAKIELSANGEQFDIGVVIGVVEILCVRSEEMRSSIL
jgi:hypothetical protein